ncbi:ComZ protein [Bacillus sp. JCM 19046]|uniref:Competence protein ComZ n=1 Tax=Shouchella xiaoxiensis TaxID=766895 RepID=A0ABS2SYR6_9BACI|nr:ComZ family protein [Shouchella xiaoxiensis]MBM7840395.1 competence protein ComZ [Shouchella xiaoxiensis]GAF13579.1 ComZ protein [Bacillus sp. JCM 19045]GAF19416.1 ComZ protein [Bacillus sp. JCM 19046]
MTNQDKNMEFMQIAMKHVPEAKAFFEGKGIEMNLEDIQPMLALLVRVMDEAYELGKKESP